MLVSPLFHQDDHNLYYPLPRGKIFRSLSGWIWLHKVAWGKCCAVSAVCAVSVHTAAQLRDSHLNLLFRCGLTLSRVGKKCPAANFGVLPRDLSPKRNRVYAQFVTPQGLTEDLPDRRVLRAGDKGDSTQS